MKKCGACGNARKGRARKAYVLRAGRKLRAAILCSLCFSECIHIHAAPALQLTRERKP